jgi:uncharacterized protein (DUF111 family)
MKDILACIFDETTTIGIRHFLTDRSILPRQARRIERDGRSLRVKLVERPSGRTAKLEADDLSGVAGSAARSRLRRLADDGLQDSEKED